MRFIPLLALLLALNSCSDGDNSHRHYIISQSQLEEELRLEEPQAQLQQSAYNPSFPSF